MTFEIGDRVKFVPVPTKRTGIIVDDPELGFYLVEWTPTWREIVPAEALALAAPHVSAMTDE